MRPLLRSPSPRLTLSDRIESQDKAAITTQHFVLQPEIRLWDATSGRLLGHLNQADLHLIGFDSSETYLFTHSGDRLQQWNVSTGELQQTLTLQRRSISLTALAAQSSTLAAASSSVVQVWNLDTGAMLQTVEIDSPRQLRAMALSPDGNVLALDQSDRLRLTNVRSKCQLVFLLKLVQV